MSRKNDLFGSIKTEGSLLTADLLKRIAEGSREIEGIKPEDYHLPENERLSTAVSRAWTRLRTAWLAFKTAKSGLGEDDVATGLTREKWLLQVFQALDYGRLGMAKGLKADGKEYPVSHLWRNTPIHLVGFGVDLDRRQKGVVGAAKISPHGLVQDYLNNQPNALWGFVTNGLSFRLLRDNASLTRQAYVEFDLESMFDGDLYADFHLFWMLCHQSRVETDKPEDCWLEKWAIQAREQGIRVLDTLRDGVQQALELFGQGILSHRSNTELRTKLMDGQLSPEDYYRQLLRLVYRLLFLFVAEDRQLLLDPKADEKSKSRYREFYSVSRLRYLASQITGSKHGDLFRGLVLLMEMLHEKGCKDLGLPALNSFLWSPEAVKDILGCDLSNRYLLQVIRSLAFTRKTKALITVDFRNLGSEELGSIYESLLELHPRIDTTTGEFALKSLQGSERKSTGSYYTPTSLINLLLKSALDPVLDRAASEANPEKAILELNICDPSCGSGHFLVAAAYRVAKRLAMIRTGDIEPSPEAIRHSVRDVIGHCIYGVDITEMAVELCKVSLWMEGMEPGKPLSFLEHRIQCGNSLIGTIPALMAKGIPDEAFEPLEGDDKKIVSSLKKRNKQERETGQTSIDFGGGAVYGQINLASQMEKILEIPDDSVESIQNKALFYQQYKESLPYKHAKGVADAWCSVFMTEKNLDHPDSVTHDLFMKLQTNPKILEIDVVKRALIITKESQCFHWHLAFPDVFKVGPDSSKNGKWGWMGGFDVMLGNPPWERIKIQEVEWFAQQDPDIASSENASIRKRKIQALQKNNPHLSNLFRKALRRSENESHFILHSGKYPLSGRGDVNTYAVFSESFLRLISEKGFSGFIVPSGIATDLTTRFLIQEFIGNDQLVSLWCFENEKLIFPAIDHRNKFCLLTLSGARLENHISKYVFFAHKIEDVTDEQRVTLLTKEDLLLFNPNTLTIPAFKLKRDAELNRSIYRNVPVLIKGDGDEEEENHWKVKYHCMFHLANDSNLFSSKDQMEKKGFKLNGNYFTNKEQIFVPLFEGKMFWQFDHRFGTYEDQTQAQANQGKLPELTEEEHQEQNRQTYPYYWVNKNVVEEVRKRKKLSNWTVCFRDITSATLARTVVSAVIPYSAIGNTAPLLSFGEGISAQQISCFLAMMNSFVFDYVARTKIGGAHLTFFILKQLPMLRPEMFEKRFDWTGSTILKDWMSKKVLELLYTSNDLADYATDCDYRGVPFKWIQTRRELLRSELDAAFFLLYGVIKEDVIFILDSFRVLRERDEAKFGEFRTKKLILERYDEMVSSTEKEVVEFSHIELVTLKEPFERVQRPKQGERYKDCVPLRTLKAAAGGFSDSQEVEFDGWARFKPNHTFDRKMFVAQVVGKSMEPLIPNGSYCLFRYYLGGTRKNIVALVQSSKITDPENGGSYTVKRFQSKWVATDDGVGRIAEIKLIPENPDRKKFPVIVLTGGEDEEFKVIAEMIEVLK